jgi:regulator of extracellular matrix RemA (YlzA/DUF370 family)
VFERSVVLSVTDHPLRLTLRHIGRGTFFVYTEELVIMLVLSSTGPSKRNMEDASDRINLSVSTYTDRAKQVARGCMMKLLPKSAEDPYLSAVA